jgi:PAS domain-containing protein
MTEEENQDQLAARGEWREASVTSLDRFDAIKAELAARSRLQSALAELGEAALTRVPAPLLIGEACALVADTLSVDCARVLEYLPAERELVVRAMIGRSGTAAPHELDSEALYVLHADGPVEFADLATETRFDGAPVLSRLGIVSGISVRLPGKEEAYGTIGAYSKKPRHFFSYEIAYLQSVANILGAAIESKRVHDELEQTRNAVFRRETAASIGSWSWSRGLHHWSWSDGLWALFGIERGSVDPTYPAFLEIVHPHDRTHFSAALERAFSSEGEHTVDHRIVRPDRSVRVVKSAIEAVFGRDGRPLRLVGTTRDITMIAEAQEQHVRLAALVELAAKEWRMTCDAVDATLIVSDANGTILRLNEAARRALDIGFEDALGRPIPDHVEPWTTMRQVASVVAESRIGASASAHDPGSGATWDITGRPLRDDRLHEERIVLTARDISADERREEIRRVGDIGSAVEDLLGAIVRRLQPSVQRLMNPEGGERSIPAPVRSTAIELASLLFDLSELSRPYTLDPEPRSLAAILAPMLPSLRESAHARGIILDVGIAGRLNLVLANPNRLQRLFVDLVTTFIERLSAGDRLRIAIENDDDRGVRLSIEGPRPIFTPEEIGWLIDPLLPRIGDGDALRLSVVHRIAEEHGAVMTAANRASDGCAFVTLRFLAIGS